MEFLVVDNDPGFRDATCHLIQEQGHFAASASTPEIALERAQAEEFDAVLLDPDLDRRNGLGLLTALLRSRPNLPVVMCSSQGTVKTAVQALQQGAVDFLEKPFTTEQFHTVLMRLRRLNEMGRQIERLAEEVRETQAQIPESLVDFETPAMRTVTDVLQRAARSPASVLILGESGTGKSVTARALHQQSHLSDRPFVTVSCPALSRELLESTLFGHVRGAFTGALRDTWGKVRAADGGTLFLDEIGDLPLEIQPKLLRLLQEREYERVGETVTRMTDVRVVAATNRDLKKRVAEGAFREDLYYRLNVITVEMPPLRARPGDILRFAEHYIRHAATQFDRPVEGLSPEATEVIRRYPWPGNLRELRNTIERAVILAGDRQIVPTDLPVEVRCPGGSNNGLNSTPPLQAGALVTLQMLEEQHIRRVLRVTSTMNEAAEILGIDQATLYRKRKRMGLK